MHMIMDKQYRFCGHRGGRGSKSPKILWTSYMEAPDGTDSFHTRLAAGRPGCSAVALSAVTMQMKAARGREGERLSELSQTT